ncbi:hypothetical protein ES705_46052 [subsurface metagenome]
MMDKETLLIEYQEGSKICMHYETLRRNTLVFFVVAQSAIMSVLFRPEEVTFMLEILLSSIAIFIGLLVLNNDIRFIDYYFGYIKRLEKIEKELGMKLYSIQKKKVIDTTKSAPNIIFFRGIPLLTSCFWLIYIIINVISHLNL